MTTGGTAALALDAYLACEQLIANFAADAADLAEAIHVLMDILWQDMPLAARIVLGQPGRSHGEKPALPSTLWAAVREIAALTLPAPFIKATPFPELVRVLAVQAFVANNGDDWAARNIRRAWQLLADAGSVDAAEPAVE